MDDQELREIKARAEAGVMGKNELRECLCDVIDMVLELRCAASERVRADEAEKQNVARLKARVESLLKDYLSTQEALTLVLDQLKLNNRSLYDTSTESMNELAKRIIRCTRRYFDSTAATDHESPAGPAGQTGTPEYDNQDSTSDIRTIIANLTADPVDEDADPDPGPEPGQSSGQEGKNAAAASAGDSTGGTKNLFFDPADPAATAAGREKKGQGKRPVDFQAWMDGLIHRCHFVIHPDKYDARFGKGGWHIDNWVACNSLQIIPAQLYVDTVYRPVIAPNDLSREKYFDKAGDAVCGSGKLRSGAWSSPSLVAYLIDMKFENSTALYAIEKYFQYRNTPLKRGWMTGWINEAAHCYLGPVVEYMHRLLLSECCTQCDETPWEVICDGRGPGSKSYFWVHTSSELMDGHRKIVYGFELTRATEHLRKFYGKDYSGVLENDAFSAYFTYEKEQEGKVTVANCYMHLRRRFVKAFLVIDKKGLTVEQLEETIEGRTIKLIGKIYRAENPLKKQTSEQRLKGRQEKVKPLVDELFRTLHEVDVCNPAYSSYLVDAVNYALNHEAHFKVFLTDPIVPIDNGFCERSLRAVGRGRSGFLFSYSIPGAEANAVCYSLIETARANGAVPDIYLTYLLEELPRRIDEDGNLRNPAAAAPEDASDEEKDKVWDQNWAFLEKMMPWSGEYKTYEAAYMKNRNEVFWQTTVQKPCIRHGEVVYETISESEAEKYDRRRMKRMRERAEKETAGVSV